MRICIVADRFPRLSETFVLHQVEGLRARGHDISVLCNAAGGSAAPCPTRRRWNGFAGLQPWVDAMPSRVRHKARQSLDRLDAGYLGGFDVILAHFGYEGARVAALARENEGLPPLVTIYHGHDVATVAHDGAFALYEDLFGHGALHLPVNDAFRRTLIAAGAPADRTVTHHMGIDPVAFPFQTRDWTHRPMEIFSVGRLTEKKGFSVALNALEQLPDLDWQYRVVGNGEDAQSLMRQAAGLAVRDRINWLGPLPHNRVRALLTEAHLFLLPSVTAANGDAEGVPVSLMEAMASGAVPISTWHSGIPDLIEDGVSGLLAPERDAVRLAERLREAMTRPDRLGPMAEAGRARVLDAFNAGRQIAVLEHLLRAVVEAGRAPAAGSARRSA